MKRTCMLRSGTNSPIFFSSVWYSILPGAVWCGAVHTCSHTPFIDRFMMSKGQSHSVTQNRQTSFFFYSLASKERSYFGILET